MMTSWLLRMVLASALVALAAKSAERGCRALELPARWVWAAAIGVVLLLPWLALSVRLPGAPPLVTGALLPDWLAGSPDGLPAALASRMDADLVVTGLWAAAALLALGLYAAGWLRLFRARRSWWPARVSGTPVLVAPWVGPAAVGVLRPVIVLPLWLLREAARIRRLVVLHEAEHLRAGDHVLLALSPLALVLMPWNVALWWLLRELRAAVEVDCDRRVVARGVGRGDYGSMLIDVAGRGSAHVFAPALALGHTRLEQRLFALTAAPARRPVLLAGASALCALLLGLLACDVAPERTTAPVDGVAAERPVIVATVVAPVAVLALPGPQYFIDGIAATRAQVDVLGRENIERVEVIKGWAAAALLGDPRAGEAGIVRITTKAAASRAAAAEAAAPLPLPLPPPPPPRPLAVVEPEQPALRITPPPARALRVRLHGAESVRTRAADELRSDAGYLVFVDGEPVDVATMRTLNPDRIASIEVLKGGSRLPEIRIRTRSGGR